MPEPLKILKTFRAEIKGVDVEKKTVTAIVSHAKKDRDGDIIPPDAFKKRLKNYKEHPVLQANHSYKVEDTIGMMKSIKLNDDHVEATFEYFVGKGNPQADWAFELAQKGMAAYSIGFQSFGFDWIEEKDEEGNKRITGRKFSDIELLEISHVAIPANPLALQAMLDDEKTGVEEKELCGMVLKGIQDGAIKVTPETYTKEQTEFIKVLDLVGLGEYADKFVEIVFPKDSNVPSQQQQGEMERKVSALASMVSECQQKLSQLESEINSCIGRVDALEAMERMEDNDNPGGNMNQPPKHYSRHLFGEGATKPIPAPENTPKAVSRVDLVKEAFKRVNQKGNK